MLSENWFTPTNITGIFLKAYHFFRFYLRDILRITLMIMIPMQIIAFGAGFMTQMAGTISLVGWTVIIVTTFGGQLWLNAALISQSLEICFGEAPPSLGQTLKRGTQYVTPLLLIYLAIVMLSLAITMVGVLIIQLFSGGSNSEFILSLQFFLFFISFFIFYPRLFLAPFYLIQHDLRVVEALRKSNELTNTNRPKVVVVFLGFFLFNLFALWINLLVPFLGFIVSVLVIPFSILVQLFLYIDLKAAINELFIEDDSADETQ